MTLMSFLFDLYYISLAMHSGLPHFRDVVNTFLARPVYQQGGFCLEMSVFSLSDSKKNSAH